MVITEEQMASLLLMFEHNIEMTLEYYDEEARQQKEEQLSYYIQAAIEFIEREGITLELDKIGDLILITMYASFLYEKRNDGVSVMPRALRYNLNNRVFQQKIGQDEG